MRRLMLLAAVLPFVLAGPARADDIADALAEATKAHQAGQVGAARTALGEALQLLSQKTAAALGGALPAALPGWQAADVETNTAAMGLIAAGIQASRRYTNAQGQAVEIQVISDSPITAQLAMVMSNPAMAGAMGKLIRLGGQRAIQTSSNEIQMLVANRILVTVSGDAPLEAKTAYAGAIDTAKLAAAQ